MPNILKKLKLLTRSIWLLRLSAKKEFNVPKLLICDAHDAHFSKLWQHIFYSLPMYLCILHTGTMAYVNGELEHGKTIFHETLAKLYIFFLVLFRLCWQIEKYQKPHNPVFAKSFCNHNRQLLCHFRIRNFT